MRVYQFRHLGTQLEVAVLTCAGPRPSTAKLNPVASTAIASTSANAYPAPMQTLALLDYGSGNVHSARRALIEAARLASIDVDVRLTDDPETVRDADRIVLPGVGHFAQCMSALQSPAGLVDAITEASMERGQPFLGICVGMQLLSDFGAEDGNTRGLGWIHGAVLPIEPGPGLAVPHMGWNAITPLMPHPVLADLGPDPHAYFVHSYSFVPEDETHIAASTSYGTPMVAAVADGPIIGTQFHPEKSQAVGLKLLSNFLQWTP
ncbi:MAG: imidazole glycerol phosphate synthase subunit HisH [Pseudomonadota bacterium]